MSDTQSTEGCSLFGDYVQFLKDHKLGGGLTSILAFFGFLVATNKVASFTALLANAVAFALMFLRSVGHWVLGVEQGAERAEIIRRLRVTRLWIILGFLPVFVLIPILGIISGVFFSKWYAFANAFWMAFFYSLFGLGISFAFKAIQKTAQKVGSIFRKNTAVVTSSGVSVGEYGVRIAQVGFILGLMQFLMWGFADLLILLAQLTPSMREMALSPVTLRAFGTLGLILLLFTVPLKFVRKMNVIYNSAFVIVILLTPLMIIFSGPIGTAMGANTMSAWGDVDRNLKVNESDISVLSYALHHPDTVHAPDGSVLVYYPGLPYSDAYYGDINGDGRFHFSDVEYLRRNVQQSGPPPVRPRQEWSSVTVKPIPADTAVAVVQSLPDEEDLEDTFEDSSTDQDYEQYESSSPSGTSSGGAYAATPPPPQRQYVPPVEVRIVEALPEASYQIDPARPDTTSLGFFKSGDVIVLRAIVRGPFGTSPIGNENGWHDSNQWPCDQMIFGEVFLTVPNPDFEKMYCRRRLQWTPTEGWIEGLQVFEASYHVGLDGTYGIGMYDKPGTYGDNRGFYRVTVERHRSES